MALKKRRFEHPRSIKSPDSPNRIARWNLPASLVGFGVILVALALVALVGMRVSWVPLRDTADTIGLGEVRQFYPLVIDLLAVVASIALYGSSGYRWAIGTVIGLTGISLVLNVAHGSAAALIDASSDAPTWGHVILASAAPVICIGLGTHLAALTWGRVAESYRALRGVAPAPAAPSAQIPAPRFQWADAVPAGATLLPLVARATVPAQERGNTLTTAQDAALKSVSEATVRSWVHRGRLVPVADGADGADGGTHTFAAADVAALP
ncbi:hypothetical protein ACIBI4_06195 [Streptomyces sp. NPDC050418]|uniref:hypothetical protein n=1 Tax=Streptomyces sp. NPDC050418 TaxID=3365612 RepID=UPI00378B52CE